MALDSVMALMAGTQPDRIPMLRIAGQRELGPTSRDSIQIRGDFEPIPGFRLPAPLIAGLAGGPVAKVYRLIQRRPILIRDRCTRCQRCHDNCPVQAIAMTPLPRIDRRRCIRCFCCVEVCPEHALRVPTMARGMIQNLIGR